MIELNLNKNNPFSHVVPASIVETGNIVLRVVKRRRKRPLLGADGQVEEGGEGVFTIEPVGVVTQTVRFRGEDLLPGRRGEGGRHDVS